MTKKNLMYFCKKCECRVSGDFQSNDDPTKYLPCSICGCDQYRIEHMTDVEYWDYINFFEEEE